MTAKNRSRTERAIEGLRYAGVSYSGPAALYRSLDRSPAVSLATFTTRFRRLADSGDLSDAGIEEALFLSVQEFKRKHGARKTKVEVEGRVLDLLAYFAEHANLCVVEYRNFWQRVRALRKKDAIDRDALMDALTLYAAEWHTFYGGGRSRSLVYDGEEYPEQRGVRFRSVAAFLRTIGRYDDRQLIWSRLKSGWNLDDALIVPVATDSLREGSIYLITRLQTGEIYVGLTVMTVEQRWIIHLRRAFDGVGTKLARAIRENGPDGFRVEVLERGIEDPAQLSAREVYWVEHLCALGEKGLNAAKPGGLGGPRGKTVTYQGERFRSIEEAADVLAARLGLERYVIRTRLQKGLPLPLANQVRRHSRHPDAGSNLYRRWLGMQKRHPNDVAVEWSSDYNQFKADVSPVPPDLELMRRRPEAPWGPENFEWGATQTKVERTHGKAVTVHGIQYPSLKAVAVAYGLGDSTLKHRIFHQRMSIEDAVAWPLGATSYKGSGEPIVVDGRTFRSKRQAILHIAKTQGITENQAKYRFTTNNYWVRSGQERAAPVRKSVSL